MITIIVLLPVFGYLAISNGFIIKKPSGGCQLDVSESFSSTPPLFLDPNTGHFVRASSTNGTISLKRGQKVFLACTGRGNSFLMTGVHNQELLTSCVHGATFEINGKEHSVKDIKCRKWPVTAERQVGKCLKNNTLAQLGFNISTGFVELIELCHDTKIHRTFYTKFILTKESVASQKNVARPKWLTGTFFGKIVVDKLFKRQSQIATVGGLLGSIKLARDYIRENGDYFLSKGHMAAKADFFYGTAQMATFYYSNAAPQWQTSNGNNWLAIENDVRRFAGRLNEDLIVYTGNHGIDTVPDINGNLVPLSLDMHGHFPVPRVYWKLVHSPSRDEGIVFIGYNSPYLTEKQVREEMLCTDICHQVKWLTWNQHNIQKGYSYCCEVNEFLSKVKEAPRISVSGILK